MRIGYACAYTPLPLIDAAGGEPFRVLPVTEADDQAGRIIHDNMCPHVKRVLDRALAPDLPALDGVVLMNSCDAMRRLADAWRQVRPEDRVVLLDLPFTRDPAAVRFLESELRRLAATLEEWSGQPVAEAAIRDAIGRYDQLADTLEQLWARQRAGTLPGSSPALQRLMNEISQQRVAPSLEASQRLIHASEAEAPGAPPDGVPTFLFGNVLPDPAALALFEEHGARIVADDLCTGSRLIQPVRPGADEAPLAALSRALLERPPCARTVTPGHPGQLGADVVAAAKRAGARAVIAHVIKFCDPYLARMPAVRQACQDASLPLLVLEGDCTLRSVGQQATRIEAFVEMMG